MTLEPNQSLYEITAILPNDQTIKLSDYKNKTLLIVNVASRCGFTPQYQQLISLQEKYRSQGLVILAFPCNQFANQEPEESKAIVCSVQAKWRINFPIFKKIDVRGKNQAPLYAWLKKYKTMSMLPPLVPWNFTKFLVNHKGKLTKRFLPTHSFDLIEKHVNEQLLLASSSDPKQKPGCDG